MKATRKECKLQFADLLLDPELMKRVHVATMGIRRAFDLLLKYCS